MRYEAIFVLGLAVCLTSYAPTAAQELNWETIIAQPGAQTTTTVNKDGSEDTVVEGGTREKSGFQTGGSALPVT